MDEALDMSVEALEMPSAVEAPADPWLARRLLTFGASEVPALLIALGIEAPTATTPRYVRELAGKLFSVKAGLRKPGKAGSAAQRGNDAEAELVSLFNADPFSGWPAVHHSSIVPRDWFPLVDRHSPKLSATPDAWCWLNGACVNVQVKTDVHGRHTEPTREWFLQVQAEMAVTGSPVTMVLYGPGWASWNERDRQEPVPFTVERDEQEIERIRQAAMRGWERVEALRKDNGR